ncbi:PPR superfamily protein [Medicago truncatula]|uniref:PPR superfamily protein n=1 Tax=Medicago truncatula TaxID=3880 RepID=A0A072U6K6_MEDTR|nr:PPR superfamily protein [Medicago truncatula]
MLSRWLIRYVGAASSTSVSSKPFVSYIRSFSSSSYIIHPSEFVEACKSGVSASTVFDMLLSIETFPISYHNSILSYLYDTSDYFLLFSLAQQLDSHTHVVQDIHTWTILLQSHCVEGGNISSAFSLFRKIINTGHHPSTSILNDLLTTLRYSVRRYTQLAIPLLRRLPHYFDIYTLTDLHNSVIHRLCSDKLVNQAYALCYEMFLRNIMPDVVTYRHLIYVHCITRQFKQAIALFKELEPSEDMNPTTPLPSLVTKSNPSKCIQPNTYSVPTLVTEQEVKSAKRAVAVLIKRGVKPNLAACQSVIGGLFKGGRVKIARKVEHMSLALSAPFPSQLLPR